MRKNLLQNLIAILMLCTCLAAMPDTAAAQEAKSKDAKTAQLAKERLVLMPLRVPEENKNMQSAMETALVQGLQQKYEVFQGEQVAQKAKEIFLKESRNMASTECNEIRCLQNIAEAFQAELIATANVTKIDGGYFLSMNIQNIFDNQAVYSNTSPCKSCDIFQVVERLKMLDQESMSATAPVKDSTALQTANVPEAVLWEEVRKSNREADYRAYLAQYPRGEFSGIAVGRINLLEEQAARDLARQDQNAWNTATGKDTEAAYQEYLQAYPKGLYLVQAQARVKKFQNLKRNSAGESQPGKVFRDCPECPEMVVLPAGSFNMGSNNGERDEQPVHRVNIGKAFAIGKIEITQGQWKSIMGPAYARDDSRGIHALGELVGSLREVLPGRKKDVTEGHWNTIMEASPDYFKNCGDDCTREQRRARRESAERNGTDATEGRQRVVVDNNPSFFKNCGDECPVEQVSWADAQQFIFKLNTKTGKKYRLPSEAEWEYACRGGSQSEYCGSDKAESVAWFGGYSGPSGNSGKTTHAGATLRANGFGLYDMSGNVWEWVEDAYHTNYNNAPADGTVWLGDSSSHTLRGGSWSSWDKEVRAAKRAGSEPSSRGSVGFRVVRVLP